MECERKKKESRMAPSSFTWCNFKEKFAINWNRKYWRRRIIRQRSRTQFCFYMFNLKYILHMWDSEFRIHVGFWIQGGKTYHLDVNVGVLGLFLVCNRAKENKKISMLWAWREEEESSGNKREGTAMRH